MKLDEKAQSVAGEEYVPEGTDYGAIGARRANVQLWVGGGLLVLFNIIGYFAS